MITYCEICDNYIDLDTDQEHIEICKEKEKTSVIKSEEIIQKPGMIADSFRNNS